MSTTNGRAEPMYQWLPIRHMELACEIAVNPLAYAVDNKLGSTDNAIALAALHVQMAHTKMIGRRRP